VVIFHSFPVAGDGWRETENHGEETNKRKKPNETKQQIETVRTERNARRTKENNRFGGYFERRIHCIPHGRRSAAANAIRA